MDARKLIIIPEYRPLYALKAAFGPTQGPLTKPCPTPVDIIGKLLLQTGKEALTIYEVIPDPENPKIMMPPVQLTLDNYRLPYNEIAGIKEKTPEMDIVDPGEIPGVEPTFIKSPEPECPDNPTVEQDEDTNHRDTAVILVPDAPAEEASEADVVEEDKTPVMDEPSDVVAQSAPTDPYAGMTKAERKRARREAAARETEN